MDLKDNTEFFKSAVQKGLQKYEELKDDVRYFQFELEGVMEAVIGDYIIKGVQGEFYPCKPDIFDKTYEPVNK